MLYWVRGENDWTLNLSIHDGCNTPQQGNNHTQTKNVPK